MKLKKFLELLESYYTHGVPGSSVVCKFYANPVSFNYALCEQVEEGHIQGFNVELFVSKVVYNWIDDADKRMSILEDIWENAVEASVEIELKKLEVNTSIEEAE